MQQMFLGLGAVAEKTYIDDLFSTYLYRGDASTIVVNNGIALGSSMSGNSANLTNTLDANKLNRTSAMTNVSAGKTFTVSAWVFIPNTSTYGELFYIDTGSQTRFELGFGNYISIAARNSSNTKFLDVYTPSNVPITPGKWNHILVSMDLTNTSNRHVYVNDSSVSMTYDGYGNENILFNESKVSIFGQDGNMNLLFGYLSNFYFDQTYRNLGTTSNRRLFYAADGTPATGQASLNPVIYYKFDTLSTTNAGSGGDFTWSGSPTLATFGPYKDTDAANGGLVWIKNRETSGYGHFLFDTLRGTTKALVSHGNNAEFTEAKGVKDFNVNGFTIGGSSGDLAFNGNNTNYASFTFRKASGFFDIISWDGNQTGSSTRTLSHSLGSIPGMVIIKRTDGASNWWVYHRSLPDSKLLYLSETNAQDSGGYQYYQSVSSTGLTVGTELNESGRSYVAYIYAGGASTASTARCVEFDGSGDYLLTSSSSDYTMGTGDFTVEGWFKTETYDKTFFQITDSSSGFSTSAANITLWVSSSGNYAFNAGNGEKNTQIKATKNQWEHLAFVRHNGTTSLYVNGVFSGSKADTHNYNGTYVNVGAGYASSFAYDGKISNFRVVKGTAVYTSSFRWPTEPLANITNTVLLCCQNSTAAGATVHAGGLTANGNPTAETDHPFDDPAAHIFGESGSESIIKCGGYSGDGSKNHHIYLGFEPQWVMIKCRTQAENWLLFDCMRGIKGGGNDGKDAQLYPNTTGAEATSNYMLEATATGLKLSQDQAPINSNGNDYIFCAIRRSDGYVGKPVELGTDVFTMDVGNGSANGPAFDSNFAVDFTFSKQPASTGYWIVTARPFNEWLKFNGDQGSALSSYERYDFSKGVHQQYNSSNQAFMFKRHLGFDVCMYKGDSSDAQAVSHSLNKIPEMIWVANYESNGTDWCVYHKGLNGGTNPQNYRIAINYNNPDSASNDWADVAPDASAFTVGDNDTNQSNETYIAMLFASVDGISKVGYYSGDGTSNGSKAITVGFQPRFVIIKSSSYNGGEWQVLDTTRGIDNGLQLNSTNAQSGDDFIDLTSTGFTMKSSHNDVNGSSQEYIYYCHS